MFILHCVSYCIIDRVTAHAQESTENLAGIYKNYFKLLIDRDFAMLIEDGKWKVNFLKDLMLMEDR